MPEAAQTGRLTGEEAAHVRAGEQDTGPPPQVHTVVSHRVNDPDTGKDTPSAPADYQPQPLPP
jgi:hypothetical protein